jgi:hypothetical protein
MAVCPFATTEVLRVCTLSGKIRNALILKIILSKKKYAWNQTWKIY